MTSDYPLSARLGAEAQCAFVDRQLDAARGAAQNAQNNMLIAGSRKGLPRSGLMAAQVPRGVRYGMALGRYSTSALRDVLIAVTSVVVDDQIVAPLVRMNRRAQTIAPAATPKPHPSHPKYHKHAPERGGKTTENALILMWSTGQAVLAIPLNALVLCSTLAGAAAGLCAGVAMALGVGLLAPRALLAHLCPSLAVLTHLTYNFELIQRAQKARERASAHALDQKLQERTRALWQNIAQQIRGHDEKISVLCPKGDGLVLAQALQTQLLAMPKIRRMVGLGEYPSNNMERLLTARNSFDQQLPAQSASVTKEPAAKHEPRIDDEDADGAAAL